MVNNRVKVVLATAAAAVLAVASLALSSNVLAKNYDAVIAGAPARHLTACEATNNVVMGLGDLHTTIGSGQGYVIKDGKVTQATVICDRVQKKFVQSAQQGTPGTVLNVIRASSPGYVWGTENSVRFDVTGVTAGQNIGVYQFQGNAIGWVALPVTSVGDGNVTVGCQATGYLAFVAQ
jgi:hypothetical protein